MLAYLFDRKSWALFWLIICFIGVLLFAAGFMVGVHRNLPRAATASSQGLEALTNVDLSSIEAGVTLPSSLTGSAVGGSGASESDAESSESSGSDTAATKTTPSATGSSTSDTSSSVASTPASTTDEITTSETSSEEATPVASTTDTESTTSTSGETQLYSIQVAALIKTESVPEEIARLQAQGYLPYAVPIEDEHGRRLTAIRIGRYESLEEAEQAALAFQQDQGGDKPLVRAIDGSSGV